MRSRVHWKQAVLAILAGVCLVVLAGCGSPGEEAAPEPEAQATKIDPASFRGKTLTYVYFTDGPDEQATRKLIKRFEQETGAKVKLQIVAFDDLETSLQTRLSGGNVPDVARLDTIFPYRDDLIDLSQYFGAGLKDQFLPGPLNGAIGDDGQLLAVPSDLTMNGPFVNVAQFEKAGVPLPTAKEPWTVDEMVQAAEKVQQANGTDFALAMDKSGHRVSTILSQYGTTLISADGEEALDPAKGGKALDLVTGLLRSDKLSRDFWLESGSRYAGANEIFLAGAAPIYLSGNWQVSQFAENAGFDWAVVPNPCAERCGGFPGGKFMGAFRESENPELGAYFVEWMNRTESQRSFVKDSLFLPTRKDLAESGIEYASRNDDMAVFQKDVEETPADSFASVYSPAFSGSADALVAEIDKVVAGREDVAAAVEQIKQETSELVEDTSR